MTLSEAVRESVYQEMQRRKMSQAKLGKLVDIRQETISQMLLGRRDVSLGVWSKIFEVLELGVEL